MTPRRLELLLWMATALVAVCGAASTIVRYATSNVVAGTPTAMRRGSVPGAQQTKNTSDQLVAILAGDLFRRDRAAPDSSPPVPAQPQPARSPAPPKPRLVLRGLVGGPPWNAIIEGVPGHDGSYVVRAGDSVAGLKIRSVKRDGATIRGMDTTWTLKLGRAP